MEFKKAYCGLALFRFHGQYLCVDWYTREIKCQGSLEKCNQYFDEYVNRIVDRD